MRQFLRCTSVHCSLRSMQTWHCGFRSKKIGAARFFCPILLFVRWSNVFWCILLTRWHSHLQRSDLTTSQELGSRGGGGGLGPKSANPSSPENPYMHICKLFFSKFLFALVGRERRMKFQENVFMFIKISNRDLIYMFFHPLKPMKDSAFRILYFLSEIN